MMEKSLPQVQTTTCNTEHVRKPPQHSDHTVRPERILQCTSQQERGRLPRANKEQTLQMRCFPSASQIWVSSWRFRKMPLQQRQGPFLTESKNRSPPHNSYRSVHVKVLEKQRGSRGNYILIVTSNLRYQ